MSGGAGQFRSPPQAAPKLLSPIFYLKKPPLAGRGKIRYDEGEMIWRR